MHNLEKEFWKFAGQIKGSYLLEDLFLQWAGSKKLSVTDTENLWRNVYSSVEKTILKKADNVTVSGDPQDIKEMLAGGASTDIIPEETTEPVIPEQTQEINVEPKEEESKTLLQAFEEPEEVETSAAELPPIPE